MKTTIIAVGKIKRAYYKEEINHYLKQTTTPLNIIEIPDEPLLSGMAIEGKKILSKIPKDNYVIALAIEGKDFDSVSFSEEINKLILEEKRDVTFIIGGSYGLSLDVKKRADILLSFSKFTFPHNLMRLLLIEQLYRAFKIIEKHPYHK